jgi:hypothetical protein
MAAQLASMMHDPERFCPDTAVAVQVADVLLRQQIDRDGGAPIRDKR